jgi:hypothetical protein
MLASSTPYESPASEPACRAGGGGLGRGERISSVIFMLGTSQNVRGIVSSGSKKWDKRTSQDRLPKLHGTAVSMPKAEIRYRPIERETFLGGGQR